MKNLRIRDTPANTHPDFTIRHAHMSRVSSQDLKHLISVSDFCINQINGGVGDTDVRKGSQYFIEDHTEDKRVRSIFENYDYSQNSIGCINGLVSFSREDIVGIYKNKQFTFHSV